METLPILAIGAAALLLAGMVKGALGLGLPLVGIAILAFVMSPAQAAALLLVPIFATNLWQIATGPALWPLLRRLSGLLAAALVATFGSSVLLAASDTPLPRALLGFALAAYGLFMLTGLRPSVPREREWWLGPVVGLGTGLIAGPTGVFLVPTVAYLQAIGLEKDHLVQALSLTFLVAATALAFGLALQDLVSLEQLALSSLALIPASLGMAAGAAMRSRLDIEKFRRIFCAALVALGSYLFAAALLSQ